MFHRWQSKHVRTPLYLLMLCALCAALLPAQKAAYGQSEPDMPIRLRRATIDTSDTSDRSGNTGSPALSSAMLAADETLLLVQFNDPPAEQQRLMLEEAGLHPLIDIPDNALLVRAQAGQTLPATLPDVRWIGPYSAAYRIAADLEPALQQADTMLDIRLIAAPDADMPALRSALAEQGAQLLNEAPSLTGIALRVQLAASTLARLIERPDIIWAESYHMPAFTNDQSRVILGVNSVRTQYGLDGTGQIIAITDSGLDSQESLSADFNGRLVRAFTNHEMYALCLRNSWSDRHGHGTHVAGIALGSGALSSGQFAGMAPAAGIVMQSVSSGGNTLDCLPDDTSYLQKAYDAGARIQNGSFGSPTDAMNGYGGYTQEAASIDSFLWQHPDHLFVVAAGNSGKDRNFDGITDADTINSPGTAKSVLTVGASENEHGSSALGCANTAEQLCWNAFGFPFPGFIGTDSTSNNRNGLAIWSSRGPSDDGRIKPEIVAPGTTVIAARSHDPLASYSFNYNANYAYDWGTSMATPAVSGMAALVRQWLAEKRNLPNPSAALLKALLLNGATNMSPGQYTNIREIPEAWPNNAEGWGRAFMPDTVGLSDQRQIWFADNKTGLRAGDVQDYRLNIVAGQPLHLTLSWTDYPGSPISAKALVDNLDLELVLPDGSTLLGNNSASLPASCRSSQGADLCNTSESITFSTPISGTYRVRVRASTVSSLALQQPYALTARAAQIELMTLAAPVLAEPKMAKPASVRLEWSAVGGATSYVVESSQATEFSAVSFSKTSVLTTSTVLQEPGTSYYRVRACDSSGCGLPSNVRPYTSTVPPQRTFLTLIRSKRP